jgi:hypothetical protein
MSESVSREKELEAQVQELESTVQNLANRMGQKVAEYETQMAVLISRLQSAQSALQSQETGELEDAS